jgi:hypothetical protein
LAASNSPTAWSLAAVVARLNLRRPSARRNAGQLGNFEGNLGTFDGGCVDNPFRWCDNLDNNDPEVLTFMSRTFDNMVIRMAMNNDFTGPSQANLRPARAAMRARTRGANPVSRGLPAQ